MPLRAFNARAIAPGREPGSAQVVAASATVSIAIAVSAAQ
jgi:hypothetical protein